MKRWLRRVGIGLVVLVALLAVGVGGAVAASRTRIAKRYPVSEVPIVVPTDEASIAEGHRLFVSRGCSDCHGADGAGRVVIDDAPGRLVGANLTGLVGRYRDGDFVRAIRDGIAPDGRPLVFMPSNEFHGFSDRDVAALVAYLKSLPRKDDALPAMEVRPLGHVLHVAGLFPLVGVEKIDLAAARPATPDPAPSAEYGRYLAAGCTGCHGEGLSGGPIPGAPPELGRPANLTPHASGLLGWSKNDFVRVMREGVRPDGRRLDTRQMPWRSFRQMTDVEIEALFAYLRTVPAKAAGGR